MDLDDVVETSDPEELAEIEAIREAHPRKRIKLFHDDHLLGTLPPSSPDLTYASSYPSVSRLATPDTSDPVSVVKDAYEDSPLSELEDDFTPFVLSPLRRSETCPQVTEIDSPMEDLTRLPPHKQLSTQATQDPEPPETVIPPEEMDNLVEDSTRLSPSKQILLTQATQDPEPPEAVIPPELLEPATRYSLRRRAIHQIRPYAVEQAKYTVALASIPEAMVKGKHLDLTEHDRDDHYVDEPSPPRRRQDDDGRESGLLKDDLSSSSSEIDETRREMKRLWRESRIKEREERSKQITERERKKRPKPFPMSEDQPHGGPSRHIPHRPQSIVSSHATPAHSPDVDNFTPRWSSPPRCDDDGIMDLTRVNSPDPPFHTEDLDAIVDKEDEKTRRRLKAAKRMMPASMLKKELEKQNADRSHCNMARQPGHDNNDVRPLLPGETRTRKASQLRDIGAVVGDSESEDEDRSTPSVSENELPRPPSPTAQSPRRKKYVMKRKPAEVVPIYISSDSECQARFSDSDSDGDKSSEAEPFDEETFAQLFRDDSEDLFEKILNRRYLTVSVHRSRKPPRTRAGTSGLTFDIKHKARGEKQTRLSFENHTGKSTSRSYQRVSRQSPARHEQVHTFAEEDDSDVPVHLAILGGEEAWHDKKKRKEKERKLQKQKNGLHTFSTEGVRIESGRSKPAIPPKERRRKRRTKTITIRLDDEGFHRAMVPRHPPPMRDYESETVEHEMHHRTTGKALITHDLDIHVLPLGLAFISSTYLGKGWLRELINVSFSDQPPPLPITFAALGFDLGPHIQLMQVKTVVGDICDRAVAIATRAHELEIADEEHVKEWEGVFRGACQLVSWHLSISSVEEAESLKQAIKDHVAGVITVLRTVAFTSSSINLVIITVCWFVVELSARLGYRFPVQIPPRIPVDDIFLSSTTVLVRILLVYGIHHSIAAIINHPDGHFDNSSLDLRTVEVWVCIIHLTKVMFQFPEWNGKLVMHPLWQLIQYAFRTRGVLPSRALEASETYWNAIFTICALNQFSLEGMTVSNADSLLPPCWDLVTDALGHVRLDHSDADNFDARSLDQRDKYLHVITYRCLQLRSRWHWKLTNANHFITCLTALFKSRNYANLRQESCEFPLFMRKNDLSLLQKCDARDPAFTHFMSLVVQHVKEQDTVSPTLLKKLRSNIVPVTAVTFSKAAQPTPLAASRLANRYIANFISLCLAPDAHSAALSAAKQFTEFQDAHGDIQSDIIRVWFMYCAFFIENSIPLEGVTRWLDEISSCLLENFVKQTNESPHYSHNIGLAITAIGFAMDVYKELKTYPEPLLLASIGKIHRHRALPDKRFWEVQKAVQKFLDARAAAIPPPQRPPLSMAALPNNQESQDEYGDFDLDLNDPMVVAAFEDVALPHVAIDQHIYQYVEPLTWYLYRAVCQKLKGISDYLDKFCDLLATWVGCVNILTVHSGSKAWSTHCFDVLKLAATSSTWNDDFKLRVYTQIFFSMLEAAPMQYVEAEFREEFMKVFFQALVVARITIEHRYVTWILTLDGFRHPLLKNIPRELSRVISKDEFPNLRLEILRAIAGELDHEMTAETVMKIHGMLSVMREILRSLASEMKSSYKQFCQEVLQLFRTTIESQERLAFFRTWKP